MPSLSSFFPKRQSLGRHRHQEGADALVLLGAIGGGEHDGRIGFVAVGDPRLGAVEHPVVARAGRPWCCAAPASEPLPGSVRAKQPSCLPPAKGRRNVFFCSGVANFNTGSQ